MKAWHFSNGTLGYSDNRRVREGEVYSCEGEIELCHNGMHGSVRAFDALSFRKGCIVSRVEIVGEVKRAGDKVVGRSRRVLWTYDATEVLGKFSRMCALDVIGLWDASDVVVQYLKTGDEHIRAEALSTAYAAGYAAYAAAYAADYAANAAATATKQNNRLTRMLNRLNK